MEDLALEALQSMGVIRPDCNISVQNRYESNLKPPTTSEAGVEKQKSDVRQRNSATDSPLATTDNLVIHDSTGHNFNPKRLFHQGASAKVFAGYYDIAALELRD